MLKTLRPLTLAVIALGALYAVFEIAMLYVTWSASRQGSINIDTAALATGNAIRGLVIGVIILVAAFVTRAILLRKLKTAT